MQMFELSVGRSVINWAHPIWFKCLRACQDEDDVSQPTYFWTHTGYIV